MADQISWDIIVFEEANVLSTVPVLCGQHEDGSILSETDCQKILQKPILSYTEKERMAHWLKTNGRPQPLDEMVTVQQLLDKQEAKLTQAQHEELDRMKLAVAGQKNALQKELHALET